MSLNSDKKNRHNLHSELRTLMISLREREKFQAKVVEEIKTRMSIIFNNFFSKIVPFYDNVEKYGRARQATDYGVMWRRKDSICMPYN